METVSIEKNTNGFQPDYDRLKELKKFDDTKAGVKGLVDSGIESVPKIFVRPSDELVEELNTPCVKREVPVINLEGIGRKKRYDEIVKEILYASENWGFFQVVNHEIPMEVLDKMLEGMKLFHEQDSEVKKEFYTREVSRQVVYNTNYDFYKSRFANWRDSLAIHTTYSVPLDPEGLPEICRDIVQEYTNRLQNLCDVLLELLSVALGLKPDHLKEMECNERWSLVNHYYPACPTPEVTLGSSKHTDPSFITVLLQDNIGGLQVLHDNEWVAVQPVPGAFIVNIGDILQIMSNDKFKSAQHRVVANRTGPRISVAFFLRGIFSSPKLYGPIKELLSDGTPPLYREFTISEFHTNFFSRPLHEPGLDSFKLQNLGDGE